MSLSIYTGTPIGSASPAVWYKAIKECGDMLVAYAGCGLYEITTDSDNTYDALYYASATRWIRLASTPATNNQARVTVAEGRMDTQQGFVPLLTLTNAITLGATDRPIPRMRVINREDAWELDFGGSLVSGKYFHLRGVKLRSSLSGATRLSLGLFWDSTDNYDFAQYAPYPTIDSLLFDDMALAVVLNYDTTLYRSIPSGKIMLFPTLISCLYYNNLGATTINKRQPYAIGASDLITLRPFTEFLVGRDRYVTLGRVAIAST